MQAGISFSRRDMLGITFFLGFSAAIAQVLLIRELLTIFRGNEFIIGIIFAAWFFGIYLGARFNPESGTKALERRVKISLILLPVLLAVSIYLAHIMQIFISRTVGTFYSIFTELILSMLFTMPVSFMVGFFFPPVVTLVSADLKERSGGNVYFIESLGSFSGGLIFSFILVEYLNPLEVIAALFIFSLLILTKSKPKNFFILVLLPVTILFFSNRIEDVIFKFVWNSTHTGKLIKYKRTRYQTVSLESTENRVSAYGDSILLYTLPDRYESRTVFHLIQSLRNKKDDKILLFGSGPGSIPYNLLKTDISELYYFEFDPGLWEIINPYRKSIYKINEDSRKLHVVFEDLKYYLSNSTDRFDMIICFPPQPENIRLNRFYTREFYSQCRNHLKDDGIFITSIHGFSNYMSPDLRRFIASIYKSFISEFPNHLKTSGETIYLIGSIKGGALPEDYKMLIERYRRKLQFTGNFNLEEEIAGNFTPDELKMLFEKTQLDYFNSVIMDLIPEIEENRDLTPGGYWNHIILSSFREKSILYRLFKGFIFFPAIAILFTIIVFLDVGLKHGRFQLVNGALMYLTGFISISAMILMIILYQNIEGIVYHRISLINALFMLGLTLGSYVFNRKRIIPLRFIFLLIALSLALIYIYTWIKTGFLFWVLLFIFSFLAGSVFPSLFSTAKGEDYHSTASVLDSQDHFGSIIGSLLTVLLLLPLLGIKGTIIFNIAAVLPAIIICYFRFKTS